MLWQYNDGGRAAAGYKGQTGDCVTRAIAIATERPYREVYDALFDASRADRDTNIARIGYVAGKLAKHGVAVVVAAISPYREARAKVRAGVPNFVEVFVDAPLETCAERDPKGLYAKALAGEIANFTGVSDPYEAPEDPELVVHTEREPVERSAEQVMDTLERLGLTKPGDLYIAIEEDEVAARLDALG